MILFWTPAPYGKAPNAITTSRGITTVVYNTRAQNTLQQMHRGQVSEGWDHLPPQPGAPGGCAFEKGGVFLDEDSLISAVL